MFDPDRGDDTLGSRAVRQIHFKRRPGLLAKLRFELQGITDLDAGDLQHAIDIFYVTHHIGAEAFFRCGDLFANTVAKVPIIQPPTAPTT